MATTFTFAATEPELKKIWLKMFEWHDVKVRGILGNGRPNVREMDISGRNVRWTDEGLEYEANENIVRR